MSLTNIRLNYSGFWFLFATLDVWHKTSDVQLHGFGKNETLNQVLCPCLIDSFGGFVFNPKCCVLGLTKGEKKSSSKFLFNYFPVREQSKLVQLWLTAANSPHSPSFKSALNVSAQSNMKAYKTSVYLLLTGPPFPPLWLHAITAAFV